MDAPSAADLEANPVVQAALASAWADSLPDDPAQRHEEGGWIYQDLSTGEIEIQRATRGARSSIPLSNPPEIVGSVVVGKFHTHPNPTAEGWDPGPSPQDLLIDAIHGVPDLIRADDGVYHSGPDQRRGGLTGNPGYPACGHHMTSATQIAPTLASDEALKIARADAERVYRELDLYRIEITREPDGWHINYELKDETLNGGGPHYVIDATTGDIVSKKYYQ